MHAFFQWLGIDPQIQSWLEPFTESDAAGNLLFKYDNEAESYGIRFHRVPVTNGMWLAGPPQMAVIKKIVICSSAMEAVAWLHFHAATLRGLDDILLMATGNSLSYAKRAAIGKLGEHKSYVLVNENSLLGTVMDLTVAAAIRRQPIAIRHDDGHMVILFRNKTYRVQADDLSLNAFSKQAGFRFRCATSRPLNHLSWLQLLLAAKNH